MVVKDMDTRATVPRSAVLLLCAFIIVGGLSIMKVPVAMAEARGPPTHQEVDSGNLTRFGSEIPFENTSYIIDVTFEKKVPSLPYKIPARGNATFNVKITSTEGKTDVPYGLIATIKYEKSQKSGGLQTVYPVNDSQPMDFIYVSPYEEDGTPRTEGAFKVTLFAPAVEQSIRLWIAALIDDGVERNETGEDKYKIFETVISVVPQREIDINVTVRNTGKVPTLECNASFFIDKKPTGNSSYEWDEFLGNETVRALKPDEFTNISITWDASLAEKGKHVAYVVINWAGTSFYEFDHELDGNNMIEIAIWIKPPLTKSENWRNFWIWLAVMVVLIIAMFAIVYLKNKII